MSPPPQDGAGVVGFFVCPGGAVGLWFFGEVLGSAVGGGVADGVGLAVAAAVSVAAVGVGMEVDASGSLVDLVLVGSSAVNESVLGLGTTSPADGGAVGWPLPRESPPGMRETGLNGSPTTPIPPSSR
jgi:hypothetical protein